MSRRNAAALLITKGEGKDLEILLCERAAELRFFGGLSVEETAEVLALSPTTVKREWSTARAWLFRAVEHGAPSG